MPTFKFDGLSRLTHTGTVELKTARLTLRRFCAEDAASAFRNFTGRPETTEFLAWEPHRALPEAEAWVSNWAGKYGDPAFYRWAIVFEGEVIGSIHLIEPHTAPSPASWATTSDPRTGDAASRPRRGLRCGIMYFPTWA